MIRAKGDMHEARAPSTRTMSHFLLVGGLPVDHSWDTVRQKWDIGGGGARPRQEPARHSLGEKPNADLNVRLKCAASGNPQRAPIAETD